MQGMKRQFNANKPFIKTLTEIEDLDLSQVSVPDVPKDIIFPDELNRYLRDQVQFLTHANGMLEKNLMETEMQLSESSSMVGSLKSKWQEYENACPKDSLTGCPTINLASSKIVELSKKLRERNSEIEACKSKFSKLEQHILEIEKRDIKEEPVEIEKPRNELEDKIKILQEKLSNTSTKLFEIRNCNSQLKSDIKMANKMLQQEVGESLESLNTNKSWRGRAQVICDLQQKNCDLREKLKAYQENDRLGKAFHANPIQAIKSEQKLASLSQENSEMKASLNELKKKLDVSRARNRVVESECVIFKTKMNKLSEENERNRDAILTLTAKVARAQDYQNEAVHQKEIIIKKLDTEKKNLNLMITKQEIKIENMNRLVQEYKHRVENQKEKNEEKKDLIVSKHELDSKTVGQYEAERLRLLELTKISCERLEKERASHENTSKSYRIERQKVAKLDAQVARMKLDQKAEQGSNYSSSYSLKSKESDKVSDNRLELAEETVKALETRLQIERQEHQQDIQEFSKILSNCTYYEEAKEDNAQ